MTKTCPRCGLVKPRSEFYAHSTTADRLSSNCKTCIRKNSLQNRQKKLAYYRQCDRERDKEPHRVQYQHEYRRGKGKDTCARARRAWKLRNPRKVAAQDLFNHRKRFDKSLSTQPCEICGEPKAHAHHENYDQPLTVQWLCAKHHTARHKEMQRLGITP